LITLITYNRNQKKMHKFTVWLTRAEFASKDPEQTAKNRLAHFQVEEVRKLDLAG
jgi:predicted secreted protein